MIRSLLFRWMFPAEAALLDDVRRMAEAPKSLRALRHQLRLAEERRDRSSGKDPALAAEALRCQRAYESALTARRSERA